jgi:hypothetical protein
VPDRIVQLTRQPVAFGQLFGAPLQLLDALPGRDAQRDRGGAGEQVPGSDTT